MAARLLKSVVVYSSNVYLDLIPAGSRVGGEVEVHFPLDLRKQPFFHFSVGQMEGQTPDAADFEQLTEVVLDQFPLTYDEFVDVRVVAAVFDEKDLYVGVEMYSSDGGELLWAADPPLGPFLVS